MEKDQTPGPTTASLHKHMLETDLADMVARQYLQPRAMGEDRANTNHRLHRTEEMEIDWTHPAKTTARQALDWKGRPTNTWHRTLDIELRKTNIYWGEAMDRCRWRDVVKALCPQGAKRIK